MEFRILGPLEVVENGNPVALGTLKERLVLGVLLLHLNEFVSRERLIDDLWGEAPPPTARKAVNVYVSQLRKALGANLIATASGGYRLQVEPDAVDAVTAERLLAEARADVSRGEHGRAAERFEEALSLWRGPTLAGLQLEARGRDEVAALDELRLTALMDRIDCDLALGRHAQALGELRVLVREHPLRERLRAQQMLALYRADRQAEALEAYAEARRTLVDDLGIEPSEALQRLQQAILRHDASLEAPEGTTALSGAASRPAEPTTAAEEVAPNVSPRNRRRIALACAVLLGVAAVGAAVLATSAGATPRITPNSLVELNPVSGKPLVVERAGSLPGPIAVTPKAVWTVNYGSDDVSRYDRHTGTIDTRGLGQGQPNDIEVDSQGNAWITNISADDQPQESSVVVRLQAGVGGTTPGQIAPSHTQAIHVPLPFAGLEALGGNELWVIVGFHGPITGDNRVAVIDTDTNTARVLKLDESATSVGYGYDTAWIGTYRAGAEYQGGPNDARIEAFRAGHWKPQKIVLDKKGANWGPVSIAVGDGAVWATTCCNTGNHLVKINPITLRVERTRDIASGGVTVGAGGVWIYSDHFVTEFDPQTLKVVRRFKLVSGSVGQICGIAATRRELWVTTGYKSCDTIGS